MHVFLFNLTPIHMVLGRTKRIYIHLIDKKKHDICILHKINFEKNYHTICIQEKKKNYKNKASNICRPKYFIISL